MAHKVIMPKAGMAMETGKIVRWLKNVGDKIETGEPVLEIETDKVNMEVEAMNSGFLLEILKGEGETVPVTETIGYIGEKGEQAEAPVQKPKEDTPSEPTSEEQYDVVVIGGGPAGYIAAIKAARLGARTALIEKDTVGGTCLNRGCIPTKTYLKTAEMIHHMKTLKSRGVTLKDESYSVDIKKAVIEKNKVVKKLTGGVAALLKNSGVKIYKGEGIVQPNKKIVIDDKTTIAAKAVIAAGGSSAQKINIPGMDSKRVLTSDDILDLQEIPKSLLIIGGGVIGVEMATVLNGFGSSVHIVELESRLLPQMDSDISDGLSKALQAQGIKISTSTRLQRIEETDSGIAAICEGIEPIECEKALLSIGRAPNTSALSSVKVDMEKGRPVVNDRMQTSIDWIYAPGDINGRQMLAHSAFKMGEIAAHNAVGDDMSVQLKYVPGCVYTLPEVGCVGLTEQQARSKYDIEVGRFPFAANGRALASGEGEGFVKVIADKKYGEILGVHILGPCAAEIINEAAALMHMEITVEEVAGIIHGHPTYSEAFMEAAADAVGECLHLPVKN